MEGSPERDKRKGKAKAEEPDEIPLPPKISSNTNKHDDYYYLKLVGQLRHEDAVGQDSLEHVTRNLFRVRNKDVPSILGNEDERIKNIHSASGATIGISSDPEARCHRQVYLELMGTLDEVKIAELLIVDAITEVHDKPFVSTALMPLSVCHHEMSIPLPKAVSSLLGFKGNNLVKMEAETGAWIELDTFELPSEELPLVKGVSIYGSPRQITNAMNMINKIISEEPFIPEDALDFLLEEIIFTEEAEHQDASMLEDEKQENVEKDCCGEKTAHIGNKMQPNVKEAEDKESRIN